MTPRTRAIIFNSPNNPSGQGLLARASSSIIADLCLEHDLLAITDEIYEHIVYDGLGHTPIATLPGMAERTVTISGISKSYSVTGWRVGYAIAPPELSVGIRRAHDFVTVGAPHPLQEAAVTALELPDSYYVQLREAYQARRDLLWGYVEAAGFVAWKPRGAYYILTDVAHFMKQYDCRRRHRLRDVPHQGGRGRDGARLLLLRPRASSAARRSGSASRRPTTCSSGAGAGSRSSRR